MRNVTKLRLESVMGRDHSEDLGIDESIKIDFRETWRGGVNCMYKKEKWIKRTRKLYSGCGNVIRQ
jgi:hypothetical protein